MINVVAAQTEDVRQLIDDDADLAHIIRDNLARIQGNNNNENFLFFKKCFDS